MAIKGSETHCRFSFIQRFTKLYFLVLLDFVYKHVTSVLTYRYIASRLGKQFIDILLEADQR